MVDYITDSSNPTAVRYATKLLSTLLTAIRVSMEVEYLSDDEDNSAVRVLSSLSLSLMLQPPVSLKLDPLAALSDLPTILVVICEHAPQLVEILRKGVENKKVCGIKIRLIRFLPSISAFNARSERNYCAWTWSCLRSSIGTLSSRCRSCFSQIQFDDLFILNLMSVQNEVFKSGVFDCALVRSLSSQ